MSYIGTNKLGTMYLGDAKIGKAYLGSDLVYEVDSGGGITDAPTIVAEETNSAVIFTATGRGTITLKINDVVQTNPYTFAKQTRITNVTAKATAKESRKLVSEEVTLSSQIPPLGSIAGLNPSGSWIDNAHFAGQGPNTETDSNSFVSPFIPVTGGQKLTFFVSGAQRAVVIEYNSSKGKVDYWVNSTSARTITMSSSTRYIRFSVYYDTATTAYYKNGTTNAYYFKGTNVT